MSDISVSKVVKTMTDDKDSYDVLLKGQMRLSSRSEASFDEVADIELKIKGVDQRELLDENGLFRIGAVKVIDLRDVQTTLDDFSDAERCRFRGGSILEQELWIDPNGEIRTRNEIRATFLDLEEQGAMEDLTFLRFLDDHGSIDDVYEDAPELIQAIRMHKHGYEFWSPRMQVYSRLEEEIII